MNVGDTAKYLYTQFLLRDVLGKMVPGTVVLAALGVGFSGKGLVELAETLNSLPTSVVLALTAATWTLGFVAQEFGALIGILRRSEAQRFTFPRGPLWTPSPGGDPRAAELRRVLERTQAQYEAGDAQKRERVLIILEASGNLCSALILFAVVWGLSLLHGRELLIRFDYVASVLVWIGLVALLFLRHRRAAGIVEQLENIMRPVPPQGEWQASLPPTDQRPSA